MDIQRGLLGLMSALGLYLLIKGSLDLFSFGKRTIKTDPLFVRVSGLLMMAACGAVWLGGQSIVPFVTLLVLAIASLVMALIRGVTR